MDINKDLWELSRVVFSYPAIDNHAHALLREEHRDDFPLEGLISEAQGDVALLQDAPHTMACFRATAQLAKLFGLGPTSSPSIPSAFDAPPTSNGGGSDWEAVKAFRRAQPYERLCRMCLEPTNIQCILIDDGLGGPDKPKMYDFKWHDRFTHSPTKRIVRVEVLAEELLKQAMDAQIAASNITPSDIVEAFCTQFTHALRQCAADPDVAGFKSIVCYRTGLDVSTTQDESVIEMSIMSLLLVYVAKRCLRLAEKPINDFVVNMTMRIAAECGKPVQFHTGLGDNDITLRLSSPAHLQPLIKAYPNTKIVLLHSSYPFTREAGYLTAVYENVYLDFGEIFPFLSADGQRDVIKQVLELAPTTKIMWSTDGHFWPESYYLGALQARQALFEVLEGSVRKWELTLPQAVGIVKRAFFENANKIYNLGLEPRIAM